MLTFSEAVQAGTGNIVISNGTDIRTISVTDATQVSINGSTVTINPAVDLNPDASYNVQMASGVIKDMAGNLYAGISDASTLNFGTNHTPAIAHSIATQTSGSDSIQDITTIPVDWSTSYYRGYYGNEHVGSKGLRTDAAGNFYLAYGDGVNLDVATYDKATHTLTTQLVATQTKSDQNPSLVQTTDGIYVLSNSFDRTAMYTSVWDSSLYFQANGSSVWSLTSTIYQNQASEGGGAKDNAKFIEADPTGDVHVYFQRDGWYSYGYALKERIYDVSISTLGALSNVSVLGSSNPDMGRNLATGVFLGSNQQLQIPVFDSETGNVNLVVSNSPYSAWSSTTVATLTGYYATQAVIKDGDSHWHALFTQGLSLYYTNDWGTPVVLSTHSANGSIAVHDSRIYVLYQDNMNYDAGDLYLISRNLSGGTWSAPEQLTHQTAFTQDSGGVKRYISEFGFSEPGIGQPSSALYFYYTASDGTVSGNQLLDSSLHVKEIANTSLPTATEGNPFSFQFATDTFTDADTGDSLSYSATLFDGSVLPAWLSFNPTTRTFSGTPGHSNVGSLNVKVIATDSANSSVSDTFTLTVSDNVAPTLTSSTPSDHAISVAVGSDIVLTFSEAVQAGTGNIVISNGTDTLTISVSDATQVNISGNMVTINPATDLHAGSSYHVQIDNGAFKDLAGNAFSGISDATTLNFGTNDAPTLTDYTKSTNEDISITFAASDFTSHFSDPDGDSLSSIKVTFLPVHGTLQLSGTNVTLNQEITAADMAHLHFVPTAHWHGSDSFGWQASDGTAYSAAATVNLTVVDNVTTAVESTDVTGAVTELLTPAGNLTDSGTIGFTDANLADIHSISAVTSSSDALGTLTPTITTDTTGTGLGGVVTWNYNIAASAVEYLAEEQHKVETFTFSFLDGHGASVERTVDVVLTGTNDAPVIGAGVFAGGVMEIADNAAGENTTSHVISNSFAVNDVDLTDTLLVKAVATGTGYLGTLTPSITDQTTGDGAGTISWNFTVDESSLDYLAAGQTLTQTYAVTVTDTAGATAMKDVVVTLTGASDAVTGLNDLIGSIKFWKTGAPIATVTSTLITSDHPIEFRNIQTAADGSRTIEIWETSSHTDIQDVQVELALPAGSVPTWQNATTLPVGWNLLATTTESGAFMLGGLGTTSLSAGPVRLGTLMLSAPNNPSHFDLTLTRGHLGETSISPFSIVSDATTTGSDGLYQHLDFVSDSYMLDTTKAIDSTIRGVAVTSGDALAALKIALLINPNSDGTPVSPYQYLAADVNKDGRVTSGDALNILKMAIKYPGAPANEWLFVPESVGTETMSRTAVHWPEADIAISLNHDMELDLIGIVKGDINGSWVG